MLGKRVIDDLKCLKRETVFDLKTDRKVSVYKLKKF